MWSRHAITSAGAPASNEEKDSGSAKRCGRLESALASARSGAHRSAKGKRFTKINGDLLAKMASCPFPCDAWFRSRVRKWRAGSVSDRSLASRRAGSVSDRSFCAGRAGSVSVVPVHDRCAAGRAGPSRDGLDRRSGSRQTNARATWSTARGNRPALDVLQVKVRRDARRRRTAHRSPRPEAIEHPHRASEGESASCLLRTGKIHFDGGEFSDG